LAADAVADTADTIVLSAVAVAGGSAFVAVALSMCRRRQCWMLRGEKRFKHPFFNTLLVPWKKLW